MNQLRPTLDPLISSSDSNEYFNSISHLIGAIGGKTGVNNVGAPRPDTISPIPEGIPLWEAEKIAREREPGDGSMQRSVIDQIEAVL